MLKNILKANKHKDLDLSNEYHEEYQYINLINPIAFKKILNSNLDKKDEKGNCFLPVWGLVFGFVIFRKTTTIKIGYIRNYNKTVVFN